MKARPVINVSGHYVECPVEGATHVTLHFPGPTDILTLPIIRKGTRSGTNCWSWNGSTVSPTLHPSVRTKTAEFCCHSWVNDGFVKFLVDSTHDLAGLTVGLLEVT